MLDPRQQILPGLYCKSYSQRAFQARIAFQAMYHILPRLHSLKMPKARASQSRKPWRTTAKSHPLGEIAQTQVIHRKNIFHRGVGLDMVRTGQNIPAILSKNANSLTNFISHLLRRARAQGFDNIDAAMKGEPVAKSSFRF
jgi:hypothetical protein